MLHQCRCQLPGDTSTWPDLECQTVVTFLIYRHHWLLSNSLYCVAFLAGGDIVLPGVQLVIYGIDGVLVPEEAIYPFDSTLLSNYLTGTLMPGSAEVPLNLVVEAVEAGETAAVAEAALSAINGGYLQQLTDLFTQATGNQEALVALAAVGNEVIMMSSCATYTPVLQQLPSTLELEQAESTTDIVREAYPAFAECVESA